MSKALSVQLYNIENTPLLPIAYKDHKGEVIHDGLIKEVERTKGNGYEDTINNHINDDDRHLTDDDRDNLDLLPYEIASDTEDGLMSKEDKKKLDDIFDVLYPVGSVFSSMSNITPTIGEFTWTTMGNITVNSRTVYLWERTT